MTAIPAISSIVPPVGTSSAPRVGGADSGGNFATALTGALDNLDASQKATDELARAAATGDLDRIEDLMVATTETQLATQLTVAVRNKAVEAFNDVMRMQL